MGKFIMNGVEYTSSPTNGFPPLIYSDEEREVGVWRDGKPLYQKTINVPASSITGNETTINHGISNVDMIYFADGCIVRGGNLTLPLVTYHTVSSWASSIFNLTRTNFILYLGNDELSRALNVYVTLRYTKTTDTPGSGIWTPFDIVNHKVLTAYGQIVKSSNTTVAAIGSATVNLSVNLAEIDFSFKGTVGGGSSDDFEWGLSVDQLRLLNPNIPNLKPMQGGYLWTSKNSNISFLGYGAIMSPTVPSYKYWLPARIYTTSGDIGGYPSSELYVNEYWFGRCYAEILR